MTCQYWGGAASTGLGTGRSGDAILTYRPHGGGEPMVIETVGVDLPRHPVERGPILPRHSAEIGLRRLVTNASVFAVTGSNFPRAFPTGRAILFAPVAARSSMSRAVLAISVR